MSHPIGFNPFSHGVQGPSTNPFADPAPTQAPAHDYGSPAHAAPEGLHGRTSMDGGARPRQPLHAAPPPGGAPHRAKLDDNTQAAVDMQERQTANNTALAMATAEASIAQGMNEFFKSMAEMQAKSTKSAGEKLASLS